MTDLTLRLGTQSAPLPSLQESSESTGSVRTAETEQNDSGEQPFKNNPLTAKQARFVSEYLIDCNATQAAIRAGYSERSARDQGCENLTKPNIRSAIEQAQCKRAEKLGVTADRVVAELAKLGFSNMADYMKSTPEGDPYLTFADLTRDQAAALSEVTVEDYVEGRGDNAREVKKVRFKLADKRAALVDLGKHLGIFREEKAAGGSVSIGALNINILQAMRDLAKEC